MTWFQAGVVEPAKSTGTLVTVSITKKGQIMISLSEKLQTDVFGGSVKGECFSIEIGRHEHEGRLRMCRDPEGAFRARASMRGTVRFLIQRWSVELPESFKGLGCRHEWIAPNLILTLPSWAAPKPAARKAPGSIFDEPGPKAAKPT